MKCPGNPEHEGIDAIVQCESSPHYAGAWCKECGGWIKWMNRTQYDDFRAAENAKVVNGRKDRVPLLRFSEEELDLIREMIRDELKKVRE